MGGGRPCCCIGTSPGDVDYDDDDEGSMDQESNYMLEDSLHQVGKYFGKLNQIFGPFASLK